MADKTNKRRPEDPTEALADMASEAPAQIAPPGEDEAVDDPLTALSAMDIDRADPAAGLGKLAQGEDPAGDDSSAPDDGTIPVAPAAVAAPPPPADSLAVRRAHATTFTANQARAHAHAYKKFMLPLLLIVGALMLVVGIVAGYMGASASQKDGQKLFLIAAVSFPIAAVLLFGAWLFYRDVRK